MVQSVKPIDSIDCVENELRYKREEAEAQLAVLHAGLCLAWYKIGVDKAESVRLMSNVDGGIIV